METYMNKCTERMWVYDLGEEILCGGEMEEKGDTGAYKQSETGFGNSPIKIYQCKSCKDIKII
jgi:hypothetical protein